MPEHVNSCLKQYLSPAKLPAVCFLAGILLVFPCLAQSTPEYLNQGWTPEQRAEFWVTPQGSWMLPYSWFLHLEQPNSTKLFRDDANMERLGWLSNPVYDSRNPDKLPIGFVPDPQGCGDTGKPCYVGLTCAACHTARISSGARTYLIDGASGMQDFLQFFRDLISAMDATLMDADKFARFAKNVKEVAEDLRPKFTAELDALKLRREYSPVKVTWGPSRMDDFGELFNFILANRVSCHPNGHCPANSRPADGPVSVPFLWDTPHHRRIHWNGSGQQKLPFGYNGPLLRNIGEVAGAFGRFGYQPYKGKEPNYTPPSIGKEAVEHLQRLEELVRGLYSPQIPASLATLDSSRIARGERIYRGKADCISCHKIISRTDDNRKAKETMRYVGTDPKAGVAFASRRGETGQLNGTPITLALPFGIGRFDAVAPGTDFVANLVFGIFNGAQSEQNLSAQVGSGWTWFRRLRPFRSPSFDKDRAQYKARPLNGIWATAPYLHNGSVPNLWELLTPPEGRTKLFFVGSREFDQEKIGFKSSDQSGFAFDASIPGNSNIGHDYGTSLSLEEKRDLLEFLKSL